MPHKSQRRVVAPIVIVALGLFMAGVAHAQGAPSRASMFRNHIVLPQVTTSTTTTTTTTEVPPTTSTTVAPTTTTVAPTTTTAPPPPAPPALWLPTGKGMWIWQPQYADGGAPAAIVAHAQAAGLTHIYVRT